MRRLIIAMALLLAALLSASCSQPAATPTPASKAAASEPTKSAAVALPTKPAAAAAGLVGSATAADLVGSDAAALEAGVGVAAGCEQLAESSAASNSAIAMIRRLIYPPGVSSTRTGVVPARGNIPGWRKGVNRLMRSPVLKRQTAPPGAVRGCRCDAVGSTR